MDRRAFLATSAAAALAPRLSWAASGADLALNGALALVPVVVGGAGARVLFLLDTGAAVTAVEQTMSSALGMDRFLPKAGPVRAPWTGFSVAGRTGFVQPALADLAPVAAALNAPVKGLLGSDFLSEFQAELSYSQRRLTLGPGKALPENAEPMRVDGLPFVRAAVRIGGRTLEGEFGLDTGLDAGVKLQTVKAERAFPGLATREGSILTMQGPKTYAAARADFVRAAGLDIANPSLILSDDPPPKGASPDYAGMLGAHLFADRDLTLDYPGRRWSLSPVMI